jgi:hypothetical protein
MLDNVAALTFTLTQEQYEALISLASAGTRLPDGSVDVEKARQLDAFLQLIEQTNGIKRSIVWVQWLEQGAPQPPGFNFPDTWPPQMRQKIELITRPVARADVDALLKNQARQPITVLCSRDPAGVLGYTPIDSFFIV